MSPSVNKHVLGGWCQQNSSVYEIIFSLNEHLNELLSPVDPVPEPGFNISWAIFFPLSGVECLSHTLSGNWKCLCFAGVFWQTREGRWQSQAGVCDCSARLHRCGWPITLRWPTGRGGAGVPLRATELLRCLADSSKWRGRSFCFSWTASQVLLDQVFAPEELKTGNERKCRTSKVFGVKIEALFLLHVVCLCTLFFGSGVAFTIRQNKSASAGNVVESLHIFPKDRQTLDHFISITSSQSTSYIILYLTAVTIILVNTAANRKIRNAFYNFS